MTQLSLFDAPSTTVLASAVLPSASPTTLPSASAAVLAPVVTPSPAGRNEASAEPPRHREGLNHMGDLAKLVLLRYELAAKRRSDVAKRRRAR